jgi:DNA polymerase-3 subunit alpha
MLWPEDFARYEEYVKNDTICFIRGSLDRRRDTPEFVVTKVIPLEKAPDELARGVVVRLAKGAVNPEDLEPVLRTIRNHPGGLDFYIEILGLENIRRAVYRAEGSLRVRYHPKLIEDLQRDLGAGNVRLLGKRGAVRSSERPIQATETAAAAAVFADDQAFEEDA